MKTLLMIVSILAAGLAAATVFQTLKVNEQTRTIVDLENKLKAEAKDPAVSFGMGGDQIQITRKATHKKYKITCPACEGEGKHAIGYKSQFDPEVYGCSICRGKGQATVTLNAVSEELCEACRGMGSIGKKEWDGLKRTDLWTAQICRICLGQGKTGKTANE